MSTNVGSADRIIRLVIAVAALIAAVVLGMGTGWGTVLIILAVVMAVTGLVGFCPLYRLMGTSTCPAPRAPSRH